MYKKYLSRKHILDDCVVQGMINMLFTPEVSLFLIKVNKNAEVELLFLVETLLKFVLLLKEGNVLPSKCS